jgi:hypothetical protein
MSLFAGANARTSTKIPVGLAKGKQTTQYTPECVFFDMRRILRSDDTILDSSTAKDVNTGLNLGVF